MSVTVSIRVLASVGDSVNQSTCQCWCQCQSEYLPLLVSVSIRVLASVGVRVLHHATPHALTHINMARTSGYVSSSFGQADGNTMSFADVSCFVWG